MQSKTSCFNKTIFLKNIARLWPIWGAYLLVWVYNMPLGLWSTISSHALAATGAEGIRSIVTEQVYHKSFIVGSNMTIIFAVVAAMGVFSYLYSSRSSCFYHALPIKRDGLFITNYLSGLCFLIVPNIIVFVLTAIVESICGYLDIAVLLSWLGAVCAMGLFFYSFGVFCAMFTGHIIALPVFYGILNFVVVGVEFLVKVVLSSFVFGMMHSRSISLGILSPWYQLNMGTTIQNDKIVCWNLLIGYALAGIVFAVLALLLYRRRRVEAAGDVVAVRAAKPVFKYGAAFCLVLLLSFLLYIAFGQASMQDSFWRMVVCLIVAGFIGYYASEMLLKKSFRVIKSGFRGWLVFCVVLLVLAFSAKLDVFGYENKVPAAADIKEAYIGNYITISSSKGLPDNYYGLHTEDGDSIKRIARLHESIVADKNNLMLFNEAAVPLSNRDKQDAVPVGIFYVLKDGRTMLRSYTLPVTQELLSDPGSPASGYLAIQNDPENILRRNFPEKLTKYNFSNGHINPGISVWTASRNDGKTPMAYEVPSITLSQDQSYRLYQAIVQDIKDGHIGNTYPLSDDIFGRQVYTYSVFLSFNGNFQGWRSSYSPDNTSYAAVFQLEATSANTIAALESMGFLDRSQLITQGQTRQATQISASFSGIPNDVVAFYQKYMEACKRSTTESVNYVHFEDDKKNAYVDSNITIIDYKILNVERVNDNLFAFTVSALNSADASRPSAKNGGYRTIYNFVGILDGKLCVMNGIAQIPTGLKDNLDPDNYKYTDPDVLGPG